jgi:PPP family 3-phenylpropionic acid transporter
LTDTTAEKPAISPELRSGIFYFIGFMSMGATTAYAGIWFADQGLTTDQIGYINTFPVFILLLVNLFVGKIADRASDWRQAIIAGSVAAGIVATGLFAAHGFWPILVVWSLMLLAQGIIFPVADAATSRLTARRGTSYGAIRAWGTVGFLLAIFAVGYLVTQFGGGIFIPLMVGLGFARAGMSFGLPRFRSATKSLQVDGLATRFSHMFQPWLFLPLMAWALVQSTNLAINAFQANLWKEQGLSVGLISNLIALGAIAEAAILFGASWLKKAFTPEQLILIAGVAAAFRAFCFGFSPGMPWLIPLQLLHAVTYGVGFVGCMAFITRWTHEDIAAEAQSFLVVVQQLAAIATINAFGFIAKTYGAGAYFASSVVGLTGAACIVVALLWVRPPTET